MLWNVTYMDGANLFRRQFVADDLAQLAQMLGDAHIGSLVLKIERVAVVA